MRAELSLVNSLEVGLEIFSRTLGEMISLVNMLQGQESVMSDVTTDGMCTPWSTHCTRDKRRGT